MSSDSSHSHPMQVCPAVSEADRVVINVGGVRYETCKSTLMSIPGTRLANLVSSDPKRTEFFFDRDSGVFAPILNYYRTGKLHCPPDVCNTSFEEDLGFWGISENDMEPCCWTNFQRHRDVEVVRAQLKPDDGPPDYSSVVGGSGSGRVQTCSDVCKPKLWALFDDPQSSVAAMIIGVISLLIILVSIILFCLGTHLRNPFERFESEFDDRNETSYDDTGFDHLDTTIDTEEMHVNYSIVLFAVEAVCTIFFTIEFLIRLICCPSKKTFFLSVMTIIDIMGFLFYYVLVIYPFQFILVMLYVVRSIRLLRLFKIARNMPGIRALGLTLRSSIFDLIALILGFCVAILFFSILAFYGENHHGDLQSTSFKNMGMVIWWAVVTMTTVGYGDMYPEQPAGMVVASLCAMTGVLIYTMPVIILVTKFAKYYALVEAKQRPLPKTRRGEGRAAVASAPDEKGLDSVHC